MPTIRTWLKLGAAAAILASSLTSVPSAQALPTCAENCNYEYNLCINVWHFPQSECDVDRRQCLRRC